MSYHISKTIDLPFDKAIERATAVLMENGFGVLTTIDVKATLKKKIDADFRPYTILGACNPKLALGALSAEPHIGTMLPCNVIVQQGEQGVEVSAIDPVASMQAVGNTELTEIATKVRGMLQTVIDAV